MAEGTTIHLAIVTLMISVVTFLLYCSYILLEIYFFVLLFYLCRERSFNRCDLNCILQVRHFVYFQLFLDHCGQSEAARSFLDLLWECIAFSSTDRYRSTHSVCAGSWLCVFGSHTDHAVYPLLIFSTIVTIAIATLSDSAFSYGQGFLSLFGHLQLQVVSVFLGTTIIDIPRGIF